jgi:hypothetical protein
MKRARTASWQLNRQMDLLYDAKQLTHSEYQRWRRDAVALGELLAERQASLEPANEAA